MRSRYAAGATCSRTRRSSPPPSTPKPCLPPIRRPSSPPAPIRRTGPGRHSGCASASCAPFTTATCSRFTSTKCIVTARVRSPPRQGSASCWTRRAPDRVSQRELRRKPEGAAGKRIDRVAVGHERASHRIGVVAGVEQVVRRKREAPPLELPGELQIADLVRRDAVADRIVLLIVHHLARHPGPCG